MTVRNRMFTGRPNPRPRAVHRMIRGLIAYGRPSYYKKDGVPDPYRYTLIDIGRYFLDGDDDEVDAIGTRCHITGGTYLSGQTDLEGLQDRDRVTLFWNTSGSASWFKPQCCMADLYWDAAAQRLKSDDFTIGQDWTEYGTDSDDRPYTYVPYDDGDGGLCYAFVGVPVRDVLIYWLMHPRWAVGARVRAVMKNCNQLLVTPDGPVFGDFAGYAF
ncbi:MAG TPA: hypothetical protein VN648_26790, partial [Candidatus Methylomirabilis sp.]|nr:hypothetical protein [Candidatus Methylomirabilis sp.]